VVGENGQIRILLGRIVYRIAGLPATEFPTILEYEEVPTSVIHGKMLADMIERTVYASSTNELQPNMNGVYMELEETQIGACLKMVATDGHRLAIAYGPPKEHGGMTLNQGILVPRRGVMEIKRLVEEATNGVQIGIEKGTMIIKADGSTLKVGLIDAEFPEYRRAIPQDQGITLCLRRDTLLHALRRMSVVADDEYHGVIITLQDHVALLHSNSPSLGEAKEELEIPYEGNEVKVGYNVRYLLEAIEAVDGEELLLEIRENNRPGVVRPIESDRYAAYIMPLRIY